MLLLAPAKSAAADSATTGAAALIKVAGTAVNQDGRSSGLTAPNGPSQSRLLSNCLRSAGMEPGRLGYIAVHGTGESVLLSLLGDD